jgi:hypothetical protein
MDDQYYLPEEAYYPSRSSVRAVDVVRNRLRNAWEHDPEFFTKFFPVDDRIHRIYREYERKLRYKDRWKGVPGNPKAVSRLYTPLNNLLNNILQIFGLYEDARRFLNTFRERIFPNQGYPIWPPLLLAGCGKHFLCTTDVRPLRDYALGISALEVRLENQDETAARDRLATDMQRMILYQYNRRYAFGLVISQQTLTVHMFDRSGVVSSPSLDYHVHPEQFCAIVAGLASMEASRLGLDTSLCREDRRGLVRTREPVGKGKIKDIKYVLTDTLYYSSDFVGRGTICFSAYEEGAPKTPYVIKDSWVATEDLEGKESEASLVAHARRQGVSKGISNIRHAKDVRVKGSAGHIGIDTILNNRQDHSGNRSKVERVHTRLIISPYGKPLHRFSDRKELLLAYHDAVQGASEGGIRNIHLIPDFQHIAIYMRLLASFTDVKPGNILIHADGDDGDRGVLIDFDHAIRIDDTSPYSTKPKIVRNYPVS